MLVSKVEKKVSVPLNLRLCKTLVDDIDLYCQLYRETHGEDLSQGEMVEQMLEALLKKDRTFAKYKKSHLAISQD